MRYVITGGSGYIGSRLVDLLARRDDTEKIVVCDLAPPAGYLPKTEFERVDVRDRDAVRGVLERARPDALVHLAFILNPSHDEELMYDVDVNGTHNVLEAAAAAGTSQVLVTSSVVGLRRVPRQPGAAHRGRPGARRGGVLLRARQDRVRPHLPALGRALPRPDDDDRAALHRVRAERGQLPRAAVDQAAVRRRRRGTLDNQIQFVHEDDVVEAITALLVGRHGGAFNVAGDGLMTMRECAELIGSPVQQDAAARLPRPGPGDVGGAHLRGAARPDRVRPPSLAGVEREAQAETGWRPRYTSRETFEITMRAHGKLPPADPPPASAPMLR